MNIIKYLHDDKKEKHSSIELKIIVPTISQIDICSNDLDGYSSSDNVEYVYYFDSVEEAESGFKRFLQILSKEYNKHISCFVVIDGVKK